MKTLLKYTVISLGTFLIIACGAGDTTENTTTDVAVVEVENITISYRSTFEAISHNFIVEGEDGLQSIELTNFSYSGDLEDRIIDKFVAETNAINFVVEEKNVVVAAEYKDYDNAVIGTLEIGGVVVSSAFYYTNKGSEMISGIFVFNTPDSLAFVKSEKITIMVKGRQ